MLAKSPCFGMGGGGTLPVFDRWLKRRYIRKYIDGKGSYIGNPKSFKSKPIFPHGIYGVFISGSAEIGEECIIFQHVTIGSSWLPGSSNNGAPALGNNVYIGAGAKIIGNVHIGNNCRIGANAVVVRDVEREINRYYSKDSKGNWLEIHCDYVTEIELNM